MHLLPRRTPLAPVESEGVLLRASGPAASAPPSRSLRRIRVAETLRVLTGRRSRSGLDPAVERTIDGLIDEVAAARGGEPAARSRAVELGRLYLQANASGRAMICRKIAALHRYPVDALHAHVDTLADAADRPAEERAARALRAALVTPAEQLIRRFSTLDDGVELLVVVRADLLGFLADGAEELHGLERVVHGVLAEWFDVGFLELRQIDWDAPASLLERLAATEAVHSIRDWDDLKHRLHTDRRVYGLFHPRLPLQPVIFVEVALTQGIADSVQAILDEAAPSLAAEDADTAIFYSITNAQPGLEGIGFGGSLIRRVVDQLVAELPNLRVFSTLSPVPSFVRWMEAEGVAVLADDEELRRRVASYLVTARGRGGRIQDPVGHFHIGNGARLERVNLAADTSERGLAQSHGVMVNYVYRFDELEDNHRAYATERRVAVSAAVQALLDDQAG